MALQGGVRLGPYEILSVLGAGGMGEVYLARDTRLDRKVAVKVLSSEPSSNVALRQRFDREARTLSSLSHPHICGLHDIGSQDGHDFLVMEYLEGETLFERLNRSRRLSIDEVLQIAIQIADALDQAHRHGVVHRDLKPANIMLTKAGAKLLDFGLAKNAQSPVVLHGHSAATTAAAITAEGSILGTLPYMAPEQLEGREADTRTDVFAFGSVLFEMATGRRAFEGSSQVTLMAAIVNHEPPPVSSLQPVAPRWLDHIVKSCLEKDPDKRWQSMADVLTQLRLIADGAAISHSRIQGRRLWPIAIAIVSLLIATVIAIPALRSPDPPPSRLEFALDTPATATPYQMTFSPSGRYLALTIIEDGISKLWIRDMNNATGVVLSDPTIAPGTVGLTWPTWSPDERSLVVGADNGKMKRIDLDGAAPVTIADAPNLRGATWNRDGVIVFGPDRGGLMRVAATGGVAAELTRLDEKRDETSHRHPSFLPDANHFIYLAVSSNPEQSGIFLASLDDPQGRLLVQTRLKAEFVPPDQLLFIRAGDSSTAGTLMAQRLNPTSLRLEGSPSPVVDQVGMNVFNSAAAFTASDTGLLVHRDAVLNLPVTTMKWFDRNGDSTPAVTEPGEYWGAVLSPENHRAVVGKLVRTTATSDLWILDLVRGGSTKLTFDRVGENAPRWSPDGTQVVYGAVSGAGYGLFVKSATGTGGATPLLVSTPYKQPEAWSPDGQYLLYREIDPDTRSDVWTLPLAGDRTPRALLRTPFTEFGARFSPDGRWVTYQSNESGRDEIYMVPFPAASSRVQISTTGGRWAKWRQDGKELLYSRAEGSTVAMMSIDVDLSGPSPRIERPRQLFNIHAMDQWDVAADGKRFLFITSDGSRDVSAYRMGVIVNWQVERP